MKNCTVPVGVAPLGLCALLMVAVKVTVCPKIDGFIEGATVVVVNAAVCVTEW